MPRRGGSAARPEGRVTSGHVATLHRILSALLVAAAIPLFGPWAPATAAPEPAATPAPTPNPGWGTAPTASSSLPAGDCAQVLFVGVRGSGEAPPYGSTITQFRDAVAKGAGGASVRQTYLDYPAAAIDAVDTRSLEQAIFDPTTAQNSYFTSVAAGVTALSKLIAAQAQACPTQRLLLAGFSQGSEVIVRTLAVHPQGYRLVGAVLLGDPVHYPGQNSMELDGTAGNRAFGLVTALDYLRGVADPLSNPSRADQVRAVVRAAVDMYEGTVDNTRLTAMMASDKLSISGIDAPRVYSVCDAGDLVCDAAKPLSRVLTTASTINSERDRARPIHLGYHGDAVANTVAAIDATLSGIPPEATSPVPAPPPAPVESWLPVGVAGVVAGLIFLVLVLHLGRRLHRHVRRRRTGRAAVPHRPAGP